MKIEPDGIPEELRSQSNWICWEETGDGDKKPRAPWTVGHTGDVSPTNPWNWADFATVWDWAQKMPGWGVGFVFTADGPYVGIDLDGAVEDGKLDGWAGDIVTRTGSFTEYSPSGTGLHIICEGEIPHSLKNEDRGVELYDRERFFTMTGNVLADLEEITDAQDVVEDLVDEYMVENEGMEPGEEFDDAAQSGLYEIKPSSIYPGIPLGENVAHPEHGSGTGANFKIHTHGHTAVCWRGEHQYGHGDGCGLAGQHLLAMKATDMTECDEVRLRWDSDDGLVFETWLYAVEEGIIEPQPIPWRARVHVANELGLEMGEGEQAYRVTRLVQQWLKSEYGIEGIEVD